MHVRLLKHAAKGCWPSCCCTECPTSIAALYWTWLSAVYELRDCEDRLPMENVKSCAEDASSGKEAEARPQWNKGLQFFLSCLSISIGLGNVWRFPTLAYQNGGGAFLIPYFVLLFVVGKPVYFLELAIGQFAGKGVVQTWNCAPGFKGISAAQFVTSFYILVSYNYIMSLCLFYLFASMQSTLPWTLCDPLWSDDNCYRQSALNTTDNFTENATSSTEQFFRNYVLRDTGEFKMPSSFDWRMALCLLLSWLVQAMSTLKGVHSIGKVAYLTSTFPYVVLLSLLAVTLLQEGAISGLTALFVPQWSKILEIQVWFNACEQSFFSLGIGMGVLTMYSSYNDFRHEVSRDAFFISIADTATSLLAGSVVFSTLGSLAHQLGTEDISHVLKGTSDLGLAFVTYPEALSRISVVPQLWSALFFFMLFLLGLGSCVSNIQLMVAVLEDRYPSLRSVKGTTVLSLCAVCFGTGLILCTDSGNVIRLLFDNYGVGRALFLYAIFEVVGIVWVYGWKNICEDIGFMLGNPLSWYWTITWGIFTPLSLIAIFVYGTVTEKSSSTLPPIGKTIGWILAAIAVGQIVLWMIAAFIKAPGPSMLKKLKSTFQATEKFGPRDPKPHKEWLSWKASLKKTFIPPISVNSVSGHVNPGFTVD